ncbi:hypothetical protein Tco_0612149 [Tanacetum coccineum]
MAYVRSIGYGVIKPFLRKLFKTLSLDESRSPEYNLFSDLEENFEEEVAEHNGENKEQYMSKTQLTMEQGAFLGVIPTKTTADVKVYIQEMAKYSQEWHNGTSRTRSTESSNGLAAIQAQLNNLGREIKKLNEKVYLLPMWDENM